jgi:hypothetical protein
VDYQPCWTGFDVFRSIYDADKKVKHCELLCFCIFRMNEDQKFMIPSEDKKKKSNKGSVNF